MQNVTFVALTVPEIWRGFKNFKSRSRDPFPTLFDLIYLFLSLVPLVINLHAKFGVSSSNRSPDMEGVPKFLK